MTILSPAVKAVLFIPIARDLQFKIVFSRGQQEVVLMSRKQAVLPSNTKSQTVISVAANRVLQL
jgi:hypothetical protein